MKLDHILHGGDYNPEQWLDRPDILEKDITYMKEAGINTVTLGVFSWAVLEPFEGEYNFQWLEDIINRLYENGISTILATPSGARPKWMADKYPEVLRVRQDRQRNLFGGRHNHCYTSPIYREKVAMINERLAKRFANHPAILMWHISNEFGGDCHCPLCQEAFRQWLKEKYQIIDRLNQCWCTTFWSHLYQSFDQIESPSSIGENAVHGLNLDWKRFVSEKTAEFVRHEIAALRKGGAKQPTTVNLMYDFEGLNYDKLAECVDVISWDSYPVWHKGADIVPALDNGLQNDYMRSLKHQPYLLMESCPSGTNWHGISKLKRPGLLTAASLQAIAHGGDSVLYFQIRQSRGSSEKFHGAVIDHYGGDDTRVFREIKHIGESLKNLSEIAGSRVCAKAAIIYDTENRWAMNDSQGPRNDGLHYHENLMKMYTALKRQGINVDIISEAQSLESYSLILAPMLYMFREKMEEKIEAYVRNGGCFVMGHWSGITDEYDRCYLGGTPYGLMDVFGLRRSETDALYDYEHNMLVPEGRGMFQNEYSCSTICDLLEVKDAQILMRYGKEFYAGTAAVTKKVYGNGQAYYIGTDAQQEFYDVLFEKLVREFGIESAVSGEIPKDVEVCTRFSENAEYIFVQNYRNGDTDIRRMELDGELLYGRSKETLHAYETLVLKKKK